MYLKMSLQHQIILFFAHPKIIVTPHLGASTMEAQENVAIDVSEQVIHILRNEPFKNAVNMPSISPELLNKLQPYFKLCEHLGKSLAQMTDGAVREITIECGGELADLDTSPLSRYVLKGILSHHLGAEQVNIINAVHLAKQRDIQLVFKKSLFSQNSSDEDYNSFKNNGGRTLGNWIGGFWRRRSSSSKLDLIL